MSGIVLTHNMNPKITAFIQARLGSHRLPRKVLAKLPLTLDHSITILEHIYGRLVRVIPKDQIVFLIPESDEELKEFILLKGWNCFAGDLDNVHDRFLQAGKFYNSDVILRITGDNPFIDLSSIESILESWIYAYNNSLPIDLVYTSPLPLGMGIESFSFVSLNAFPEDPKDYHKEHVSIHIKEEPSKFRIIKIPSGIDANFSGIRMTVDEEKDFTTLSEVSYFLLQSKSIVCNSMNEVGAKEIINCRNSHPTLFQKNEIVEQVRFHFPEIVYPRKEMILILALDPAEYGTGHYERMKILSSQLAVVGYKIEFHVVSKNDLNSLTSLTLGKQNDCLLKNKLKNLSEEDWILLDIRDSILPFDLNANKLYLDNFHESRSSNIDTKTQFLDLLPHPQSPSWNNQSSILASNLIHSKIQDNSKLELLVYSGSISLECTQALDTSVCKIFQRDSILRIGTEPSDKIRTISRLTKTEWFSYLNSTKYFLSYFGQGLLEACLLGKLVASYSISDIHKSLSQNMESINGIPYIGDVSNLQEGWDRTSFHVSKQKIKNRMTEEVLHILYRGRD